MQHAAKDEEQGSAEGRTAGSSDQTGLDDWIAKQRLHQGAADTQTGADKYTENRSRQPQLEKNALVQSGFSMSGNQGKKGIRDIGDRKIDGPKANARSQHDERDECQYEEKASARATLLGHF